MYTLMRRGAPNSSANFMKSLDIFADLFDDMLYSPRNMIAQDYGLNTSLTDTGIEAYIELAGVHKDNLKVTLQDRTVNISAKKIIGSEETNIKRTFTISKPYDPETLQAELEDGILKLNIEKSEGAKEKQIQVNIK